MEHFWRVVRGRVYRLVSAGGGAFVPECYPGGALFGGTLMSVVLQNFSEIGQSAAELQLFNKLKMAADCHLGCLKEAYLDHSTRRGPNFLS